MWPPSVLGRSNKRPNRKMSGSGHIKKITLPGPGNGLLLSTTGCSEGLDIVARCNYPTQRVGRLNSGFGSKCLFRKADQIADRC